MRRDLRLVVLLAVVLALTPELAAAAGRFDAYVAGAGSGRGHSFVVGNGLNLVFRDRKVGYTPYRVCWASATDAPRCWRRRTGARGNASTIFTAAPGQAGVYTVTWYVASRPVAQWRFTNGMGD